MHDFLKDAKDLLEGKKLTFKGYGLFEKESLKSKDNPLAPLNATEKRDIKIFDGKEFTSDREVSFEGRLTGGCLDCLVNLTGTKFDTGSVSISFNLSKESSQIAETCAP